MTDNAKIEPKKERVPLVMLSDREYDSLIDKFGTDATHLACEILSSWKQENPHKCRENDFLTIVVWPLEKALRLLNAQRRPSKSVKPDPHKEVFRENFWQDAK